MSGPLGNPPAEIVGQLLVDLGIGSASLSSNWAVFIESEPDEPDNSITVYDTANELIGSVMVDGEVIEYPGVQVRIRSQNYPTGWTKMEEIKNAFDRTVKRTLVTIGSNVYRIHTFIRASGPFHIGREGESSDRDIFTINYTCALKQTSP